jgi:hypothetical protein
MSDKQRESEQDDWESEGGAYAPEPNEKAAKEQMTPLPIRNSISGAWGSESLSAARMLGAASLRLAAGRFRRLFTAWLPKPTLRTRRRKWLHLTSTRRIWYSRARVKLTKSGIDRVRLRVRIRGSGRRVGRGD